MGVCVCEFMRVRVYILWFGRTPVCGRVGVVESCRVDVVDQLELTASYA
jgi:hypothetical protein